jgi:thiaminase (transcriptional activator TenA)
VAALSVLVVAEWLYLDWASRAPQPLPKNFVHAEWITLHDNPNFRGFVHFLRAELDRVGPRGTESLYWRKLDSKFQFRCVRRS